MNELDFIELYKKLTTKEQIDFNDRLKEVIGHSQAFEYKQFHERDLPQIIP